MRRARDVDGAEAVNVARRLSENRLGERAQVVADWVRAKKAADVRSPGNWNPGVGAACAHRGRSAGMRLAHQRPAERRRSPGLAPEYAKVQDSKTRDRPAIPPIAVMLLDLRRLSAHP